MSTDRELLEAAAKAAGIEGEWMECMGTEWFNDKHKRPWNPLTDDSDAFRLAVALDIAVSRVRKQMYAIAKYSAWAYEDIGDDKNAATRRAIVRAAAALART